MHLEVLVSVGSGAALFVWEAPCCEGGALLKGRAFKAWLSLLAAATAIHHGRRCRCRCRRASFYLPVAPSLFREYAIRSPSSACMQSTYLVYSGRQLSLAAERARAWCRPFIRSPASSVDCLFVLHSFGRSAEVQSLLLSNVKEAQFS